MYPLDNIQIAIEGCLHGKLDLIYTELQNLQKNTGIKIDCLIVCGDFQAIRDNQDLQYLHCPPKYKQLGSFHKYYTGQIPTPYLTIFITGNHEASNYMRDLYFGGWIAPRIYYLGQAGSIFLEKGNQRVRVTGISGIYNHNDFKYGLKTEVIPLTGNSIISSYHVKQLQIFRLQLLARINLMKIQDPGNYGDDSHPFDLFLSHDWPKNIALYGNTNKLLEEKQFLRDNIENGTLGSPASTRILSLAKPNYWFSAHMHVKYAALYPHSQNKYTHFLSLGKYIKNKQCLQLLKFTTKQNNKQITIEQKQPSIILDRIWLTVLKLTLSMQNQNKSLYKIQQKQQQLKLIDTQLMNNLIKKYSEIKNEIFDNCEHFQKDMIKWKDNIQKGTQIQQTLYLINNILKLDSKMLQGIIFPIKKTSQIPQSIPIQINYNKKNDDEIQLDL